MKPEDQKKAKVLGGLVLCVAVIGGWHAKVQVSNIMSTDGNSSEPVQVALASSATTAPVAKSTEPAPIKVCMLTSAIHTDPFAGHGYHFSAPVKVAVAAPVRPMKTIVATTEDTEPMLIAPPVETMSVKGVITGESAIAIMKIGDKQIFVKQGETFQGGYRLQSVSPSEVVVVRGLKAETLPVVVG